MQMSFFIFRKCENLNLLDCFLLNRQMRWHSFAASPYLIELERVLSHFIETVRENGLSYNKREEIQATFWSHRIIQFDDGKPSYFRRHNAMQFLNHFPSFRSGASFIP